MNDDLGLFTDPETREERAARGRSDAAARRAKRRRKRTILWVVVALVVLNMAGTLPYAYGDASRFRLWAPWAMFHTGTMSDGEPFGLRFGRQPTEMAEFVVQAGAHLVSHPGVGKVAFTGGMDICDCRWDSRDHPAVKDGG